MKFVKSFLDLMLKLNYNLLTAFDNFVESRVGLIMAEFSKEDFKEYGREVTGHVD